MLNILHTRLKQGHQTNRYPREIPALPDRLRGRPLVNAAKCVEGCRACADACPTDAIGLNPRLSIDLGKCLFCPQCAEACPTGAIAFRGEFRLATRTREALVVKPDSEYALAQALQSEALRLFGRSLKLRVVSAGGCNGCEVDVNVLTTIGWDLGRFGIQIVASPRHADALLLCGPVTKNMELALKKTYDAIPAPKLVIAVGACAIGGGPYASLSEQCGGADGCGLPVDLYIPGCPPHPLTILDGLLRLLGKVENV